MSQYIQHKKPYKTKRYPTNDAYILPVNDIIKSDGVFKFISLVNSEKTMVRCDQDFSISNCDSPLCRICWPDENFTNYDDFDGYSMTNHGDNCDAY